MVAPALVIGKIKDLPSAITFIENAKDKDDLFAGGDVEAIYKKLARLVHPDLLNLQPADLKTRGEAAATKLNQFRDLANGKGKTSTSPAVFGQWVVEQPIVSGDLADIFQVNSTKKDTHAILKVIRHPRDNDLIEAESTALKALHADTRSETYKIYIPTVLDRFKASDRAAIVLSASELPINDGSIEPMLTLSEIMQLLGGTIDFRHLVWMSNRMLSALGFVHENGFVHGAVVPTHAMYGPVSHGMRLIDWCYSVSGESKKHIPAIVPAFKRHYPKEVLRKIPPTPATDIYMWAFMMREIAGKTIPHRFKGLFDWCLADAPSHRPQNAWTLQDQWGALAKEEFGPSRYLKLVLPIS